MSKNFRILSAFDEHGEPISAYERQAASLAKSRDLGITRDRVLCFVAVEEEQVVGAGWGSFDGNAYEFDIAVSQNKEGAGIGRSLVKTMMSESELFYEPGEGFMQIAVTSPKMKHILESEGFIITKVLAPGYVLMEPSDDVELKPTYPENGYDEDEPSP